MEHSSSVSNAPQGLAPRAYDLNSVSEVQTYFTAPKYAAPATQEDQSTVMTRLQQQAVAFIDFLAERDRDSRAREDQNKLRLHMIYLVILVLVLL